jgi:hypothetical protein
MSETWDDNEPYDDDYEPYDYQPYAFEDYPCFNGCGNVYKDYDGKIIDSTTQQPHTCLFRPQVGMLDIKSQPTFAKENHMFNSVKVISRPSPLGINADSLNVGEYARVVGLPEDRFFGNVVLKTRNGVVNISDPNAIWDLPFSMPQVERLNTGDKLEITIGFTAQIEQEIKNLKASNKIMAIKRVRELTNWGLSESKFFVDAL